MSWTDKTALNTMWKLAKKFKIRTLIETGAYKGTNAKVHAKKFDHVVTCELKEKYYKIAKRELKKYRNVSCHNINSRFLLHGIKEALWFKKQPVMFYLDAHFYDPKLSKDEKFVVLDELKALESLDSAIIIIHDFDNGEFGHITYDGVSLDMNLLRCQLYKVNNKFNFYTNTKTKIIKSGKEVGLKDDREMKSTLKFVWSKPEKTHRGLLYCIPDKYRINGKKHNLRKIH